MQAFNINNDDVVQMSNRLEQLHRSGLPVAVRQSLNEAAFQMKKHEIMRSFDRKFIVRKQAFIKNHTAFNRCKNTFEIREMYSEAGIRKGMSQAGDNLSKQEFGGRIHNRNVPQNHSIWHVKHIIPC